MDSEVRQVSPNCTSSVFLFYEEGLHPVCAHIRLQRYSPGEIGLLGCNERPCQSSLLDQLLQQHLSCDAACFQNAGIR